MLLFFGEERLNNNQLYSLTEAYSRNILLSTYKQWPVYAVCSLQLRPTPAALRDEKHQQELWATVSASCATWNVDQFRSPNLAQLQNSCPATAILHMTSWVLETTPQPCYIKHRGLMLSFASFVMVWYMAIIPCCNPKLTSLCIQTEHVYLSSWYDQKKRHSSTPSSGEIILKLFIS